MAHDEPDDDSCGLRLGSAHEADAQAIIDMGREERVHAVSVSGQPLRWSDADRQAGTIWGGGWGGHW